MLACYIYGISCDIISERQTIHFVEKIEVKEVYIKFVSHCYVYVNCLQQGHVYLTDVCDQSVLCFNCIIATSTTRFTHAFNYILMQLRDDLILK